ncbi:hypothetical protein BU24DRAFT_496140 [Aaosphaeria arxii CBS 175.79]|uniref:Uncharacterized protein n=1 Tax=Aaosphaeria arxii CBS 175.79 TaxID=1450172 RepID=A0A6A5XDB2_9PLEO|nr:uncharacterized protein BU24DRAFT_496140 [Aaosphaeria arxii CBS 175.79]KAF2010988.1 hypothetical protein BU24DRAFT_496140 [Aaosphaeria arxii CBS 175.79]
MPHALQEYEDWVLEAAMLTMWVGVFSPDSDLMGARDVVGAVGEAYGDVDCGSASQNTGCIQTFQGAVLSNDNIAPACTFSFYSDNNCKSLVHTVDTTAGKCNCLGWPGGMRSYRTSCTGSFPIRGKRSLLDDVEANVTTTAGVTEKFEKRQRCGPAYDLENGATFYMAQYRAGDRYLGGQVATIGNLQHDGANNVNPNGVNGDMRTVVQTYWDETHHDLQEDYHAWIEGPSGLVYEIEVNGLFARNIRYPAVALIEEIGPQVVHNMFIMAVEYMVTEQADIVIFNVHVAGAAIATVRLRQM